MVLILMVILMTMGKMMNMFMMMIVHGDDQCYSYTGRWWSGETTTQG